MMQYNVTYMLGEKVRQSVMNQRELDECRSRCEVVEAVPVTAQ
jgi:hypothetical protein